MNGRAENLIPENLIIWYSKTAADIIICDKRRLYQMQIIVIKSPKALSGLLRLLFGFRKEG